MSALRGVGWLTAAALALSACARDEVVPPTAPTTLRDADAPLGGTARFDADRFAGDWVTRACLGTCGTGVSYTQSLTGALIQTDIGGQRAFLPGDFGILRETQGEGVLVVMWVDEGFRTAAVGYADGSGAAILDRATTGGADRIAAAREILDFNGWDTGQLRRLQ